MTQQKEVGKFFESSEHLRWNNSTKKTTSTELGKYVILTLLWAAQQKSLGANMNI